MGRKKNLVEAEGAAAPVCPNGHGPLNRRVADTPYECDNCSGDINMGGCFFGCQPCDHSICGNCYVALSAEAAEKAEKEEKYKEYIVPEGVIHKDVWDLCEHFQVEDRVMKALNEAMKTRHETWKQDFAKLWMELKGARVPAGLLYAQVKKMQNGTFLTKKPANAQMQRVIKKYSLEGDAQEKMVDFLHKRGDQWEKDLWEIEQRLIGHPNPFMMCLRMVVVLQQGLPLPPIKQDAVRRQKEKEDREEERERREERRRDQKSERYRSGSRSRSRGGDRGRSRDRGGDRGRGDRGDRGDRGGGGDRDRGDRGGRHDNASGDQTWSRNDGNHSGTSASYGSGGGGGGSYGSAGGGGDQQWVDWNAGAYQASGGRERSPRGRR